MSRCAQVACQGTALAPWWALCENCTLTLAEADRPGRALADQIDAAGWDATTWAERVAPNRWGHGSDDEPWLLRIRALVFATCVSARAQPCPHTAPLDASVPVLVTARRPWVLACPPCAEPVVAETTTAGHACDRCGQVPVSPADRVAVLTGQALLVVAQICPACTRALLEDVDLSALP